MVWAEHGVFNIEKKQERKYDERAASFNGGERRQLSRPFFVLCFPSIYFSRSHFKNKPVGLTRWIRWLCVCTCITLLLLLRALQVFLFLCISLDRQPYCIETLRPVVSRELSLIVSRMNSWQIRLKFHINMYVCMLSNDHRPYNELQKLFMIRRMLETELKTESSTPSLSRSQLANLPDVNLNPSIYARLTARRGKNAHRTVIALRMYLYINCVSYDRGLRNESRSSYYSRCVGERKLSCVWRISNRRPF